MEGSARNEVSQGILIDGGTKTEEKTVAHQTSLELLWFLCNLKGQVSVR